MLYGMFMLFQCTHVLVWHVYALPVYLLPLRSCTEMRMPREESTQAALSKELRETRPMTQQLRPYTPEFDTQHPQICSQLCSMAHN